MVLIAPESTVKTFYLIDGHAQIFRAYYAPFGQLNSPTGEPTKAVHIFTQMMLSILRDKHPDYLAVALDVGDESTERRQFYPEYKANRDKSPEDLGQQVTRIVSILEAMNIPVYAVPGFEADDVIATAAKLLEDQDVELHIVSRDKDLHQVLSKKVKMWDPQSDRVLDATSLEEQKGYTPRESLEIQSLTGDSTDNIPGVPGIGPKKALQLIKKYETAANVFEHAHELTPKMKQNVLDSRDQFDLTRRLVTLSTDVSFDFRLEDCVTKPPTISALRPIFEELGFRRLLENLDEQNADGADGADDTPPIFPRAEGEYHLIDSPELLGDFVQKLSAQSKFAIDTETTSLHPVDCDLVGLSFCWKEGEAWYVAIRSSQARTLDPQEALDALRPILEDASVKKCGQNIKYDMIVLRRAGIELHGVTFDSMVASYLLNAERRSHGMDALAKDLLSLDTISITELIGKGKQQGSMLDADLEKLSEYACEDADITWRLMEVLDAKLSDPAMRSLFDDVEMPLVGILANMEYIGVSLDQESLREISRTLGTRIDELRVEIYEAAGREFTIDSPKQLSEILFDELGMRVVRRTKTSRSTDASVLHTLVSESDHPLPQLILEYRELNKLKGTYLDPIPDMVSPQTGRLHASFNQTIAATGRLSSSNPNLQNIPIRTEQGREIRKAFVPKNSDYVLITADYSQIELRILAHLSKDPALLEAFHGDQDIHRSVAAQIFDVPPEEVTSDQRSRAKAVNFGIIYGQGAFGLSRLLDIPRAEASEFIRMYKEKYSGIESFMNLCVQSAVETGNATTILGRRRPILEVQSRNQGLRAQGERLAVNSVVQGSAADLIKIAMVRIDKRIRSQHLDLSLLIQVHDELVFEAPRDRAEEFASMIQHEMASALHLDVPLVVDVSWGDNWLEGKG